MLQLEFTFNVCGSFTKHLERIEKSKETVDLNYFYKNELDNSCFAHDIAYGNSKHFAKGTKRF